MRITPAQKEAVAILVERWRPRLMLQSHRIELLWHTRPHSDDAEKDEETAASSHGAYAGLDAELHVYPPFFRLPEDVRERIVLHELVHIALPSLDEAETPFLTEILWRAFEGQP